MAPNIPTQAEMDNTGRIHKNAYVGSLIVLFVVGWIASAVRFYIRLGIQKLFSLDDVLLLIGLTCMTAMFGMMLGIIDDAYATNAVLQPNGLALALQPGFVQKAFNYKKKIDIVMMLAWATILCVKLSYLFLFRRLIDRLRYMTVYWWVIFIFIIGTSGYVFAIYYLVCPYYDDFRAIQCVTGDGISRTIQYTIIQISLDIIGDILILVIPIHIIWKVKIRVKQKVGLVTSLCLTIVIITITVIRAAGFMNPEKQLDQLWDGYWNIIAAEVGIIMTSATAFRTLYITNSAPSHRKESSGGRIRIAHWWYQARSKIRAHKEEGEEGKELSAGSGWSWSNNRVSTDAPQVPRHVLPRGHNGQNTMRSGQGIYESRFRMSNIINDLWDDSLLNVDEELQTRRHQIEIAGGVSHQNK